MNLLSEIFLILGAYLLGSIPFGHLITKKLKGIDVRKVGSGSTGATNINRVLGKNWGLAVLIMDVLKGFIVASIALIFGFNLLASGLAIFSVVLGHTYSVFIRFKGGKGVATFLGTLIPILIFCLIQFPHLWTYLGLIAVITGWIIVHKLKKRMGLSSLFLMPLLILYFSGLSAFTNFSSFFTLVIFIVLVALLVIYNHRENWKRLWRREEPETDLL
jgi:glycerol-3-phosphate acyltransferase PlsY